MFKIESTVPQVYLEESRDFQSILRSEGIVLNAVKQDVDTTAYLTSTKNCQVRVLNLLKSKLGFFTDYDMNDDLLRGILDAFPSIVKNKGSLKAIQQALNVFLKSLNIKTEIILKVTGDTPYQEGAIIVGDHTILIGIKSAVQNYYILEELFKYIIPAGYNYTFLFYSRVEQVSWMLDYNTGDFVIVNTNENDSIRKHGVSYNAVQDKLINNVLLSNVFPASDNTN